MDTRNDFGAFSDLGFNGFGTWPTCNPLNLAKGLDPRCEGQDLSKPGVQGIIPWPPEARV
ncbi:hypothetical protein DSLASN_15630 [Desulfoluna limicola]|uniref:Uncharacterized protein n=1 Tax=Desulfoluna limicola TaxID=2810562 RepID=A0ABM7PFC3_9BACT|nr:hypothetical protein DSLASN_15630 [Desulfoluna limicola]